MQFVDQYGGLRVVGQGQQTSERCATADRFIDNSFWMAPLGLRAQPAAVTALRNPGSRSAAGPMAETKFFAASP
ncbi:hypothetical protein [Xanthomonas translucens]|uniref:hypothetical protein n=1 Tax=Xanthomonas campestris pv. translucens TaxID=343 RepID=UPI00068594EE|nr:hypothetical protein [Xanthomonas translucens]MCC8448368.1 hypothetical protein [Xanthomonas translucens pv. translucens]MCT8285812.1 hypothetical protein [Xanthomonas translucens pv. translucens]MCT8303470.1 hypothetical protein [Xanthomonas translucens pv. translucens]QSQ31150.1 hypothetical protein ISN30_04595 [Xanthomonas translucens pv. translucens]QSQ46048.1 hypothetical protein ISN34_03885 [Xanthomonas translucens pv. translucens]